LLSRRIGARLSITTATVIRLSVGPNYRSGSPSASVI
jgi:hypothetical protein